MTAPSEEPAPARILIIKVTSIGDATTFTTYTKSTFDNLDRATQVEQYRINASGPDTLLARSKTAYDDHGRVFKSEVYSVTGGAPGTITSSTQCPAGSCTRAARVEPRCAVEGWNRGAVRPRSTNRLVRAASSA